MPFNKVIEIKKHAVNKNQKGQEIPISSTSTLEYLTTKNSKKKSILLLL
jgi:hypothetical protein